MYGLAGPDNDYLLLWQWRCIGKVGHNDVNIQNSPNYFKQIVNTQKICIKYSLNVNICLSIIVLRFCCKSSSLPSCLPTNIKLKTRPDGWSPLWCTELSEASHVWFLLRNFLWITYSVCLSESLKWKENVNYNKNTSIKTFLFTL